MMQPAPLFLGLDLGTSSVKALIVDESGAVIERGSGDYTVRRPAPGYAEQNPGDWWQATITAIRQAIRRIADPSRLTAIGVTGQMHGTVLLDHADEPLGPAIIWEDQRSWQQVQEITTQLGSHRLIAIAGSPLATGFQAATLRWLQRHEPQRWANIHRVLAPKDEIRRRLTGISVTDPSEASGTLLFDVRQRCWAREILDAVGIDVATLPPVQPSSSVAGNLTLRAASALGLPANILVATGGGDAPCGLLGAGIVTTSTMLLSFSTGAQVMVPSDAVTVDRNGRIHTFCAALEPGPTQPGWYMMGATLTAGLAVQWFQRELTGQSGNQDNGDIMARAAAAPAGAGGLLFLPYLVGERSPKMDPQLRGAFFGLTARHGHNELARAVIEGVTFAAFHAFGALAEQRATPMTIVAVGGGARSRFWRQMAADIFGLPVRLVGTADQAAMGAALLAASAATGEPSTEIARRWTTSGEALEPDPVLHERYQDLFALYCDLGLRTTDLAHQLAAWSARGTARS